VRLFCHKERFIVHSAADPFNLNFHKKTVQTHKVFYYLFFSFSLQQRISILNSQKTEEITHKMSDAPLVTIQNVAKRFEDKGPPALKDITASINQGEIVGIAGPDGSGKTTLIRLIAGLLMPTKGSISIAGFDTIKNAAVISSLIGYMPQKFGLYEDLTVMQNLNLYANLKGVEIREKPALFEKLLRFTGLAPFTNRRAKALSGGMKQKLGLAAALISKPKLLLLDEPSVGVDPISRRELWKMVHELLEEGITVVWSTSYLDEAERCRSVILLNEGNLLFQGSPQALTERVEKRVFKIGNIAGNRREILSQILQQENTLDGTIQGQDLRIVVRTARQDPIIHLTEKLLTVTPASPRFEDAFIDILGGGPDGVSQLAQTMAKRKTESEIVVEARNLTKQFGSFTAADNITFSVRQGEIFGLLGPNGAGKSTTFKMLCGLLKPTKGNAFVNGVDLQQAPSKARSHIGYMAQKFSLYGNLSVYQNLDFFAGINNLGGNAKKTKIEQMIEIFNLQPFLQEITDKLPLGFKQRLALSCAVMHDPEILFLDEATSGVDPITRREFWTHINGLVEKGITVIVTTHFMDEAEYCDRLGLVYRSQLINMGTPDSLKREAQTQENRSPTLEDAFIHLIEQYEASHE
jgi:ABC-2 type transport system ATP-binding protein